MTLMRILGLTSVLLAAGCSKHASSPTSPPPPPPNQPATLKISSVPTGVRTYVDGTAVSVTPSVLTNLAPGAHAILLQRIGYADTTCQLNLAAGQVDSLAVTIRPLAGTPRTSSVFAQLSGYAYQVAVGPGGNVYVTTDTPQQVRIYSTAGALLSSGGISGTGGHMAVASTGAVYGGYTSGTSYYLSKYSRPGAFVTNQGFGAWPIPAVAAPPREQIAGSPGLFSLLRRELSLT